MQFIILLVLGNNITVTVNEKHFTAEAVAIGKCDVRFINMNMPAGISNIFKKICRNKNCLQHSSIKYLFPAAPME
jgi:hypothetical protein